MKLQFKLKTAYGKDRYYPINDQAKGVVELTGRQCLKLQELERLEIHGLAIEVLDGLKQEEAI